MAPLVAPMNFETAYYKLLDSTFHISTSLSVLELQKYEIQNLEITNI